MQPSKVLATNFSPVPSSAAFPWVYSDAGRSQSARPKQRNDCTVRAFALARGLSYDEAYEILKDAGRACGKRFHFSQWVNKQPWAIKLSFPAVKGERRMNPVTFTRQFPSGKFICKTAKHVFAVIDGVVHDDFLARSDRCIYTAWKV